MNLSIVIPLKNEAESLPELEAWIRRVCEQHHLSYEIIMVDDGSTDGSWKVIEALQADNSCVRGIKFRRNYGKSAALHTGFQAAEGDVVITMDADGQHEPAYLPQLLEAARSQAIGPDRKIYSNYEAAAWFLTRRNITRLPHGDVTEKRVKPEEVLERFPTWPGKDGSGYVIWIDELSFKPYVLNPQQLAARADFQRVYWSKGAEVFLLTPK